MELEVLAQHQVVEFRKLRDYLNKWRIEAGNNLTKIKVGHNKNNGLAAVSIGQSVVTLDVVIKFMDNILEQV